MKRILVILALLCVSLSAYDTAEDPGKTIFTFTLSELNFSDVDTDQWVIARDNDRI